MYDPPKDTRAYFRGMCLQRYADEIASASWDSVIFDLKEGPLKKIFMLEPLRGTEAHVRQLLTDSPSAAAPFPTIPGPKSGGEGGGPPGCSGGSANPPFFYSLGASPPAPSPAPG